MEFQIRQTYLRWVLELCPAGAHALVVEGRPGPRGPGAQRGTIVHHVLAQYAEHLSRENRATDFEALKTITQKAIADSDLTMDQRLDVLAQADRIGESFALDHSNFYGAEKPFAMDIPFGDGREACVTGTLDLLYFMPGGERARIDDGKSNHQIWPDSRVRADLQLKIYAMLVADHWPGLQAVEGRLYLTRYGMYLPQHGEAVWTRDELLAFRDLLGPILRRFFDGKMRHDYRPGTHCQYCPRRKPNDCSLWKRTDVTTPPPARTFYQARRLAQRLIAVEQERQVIIDTLKPYINEHGPLGTGVETVGFFESESVTVSAAGLRKALTDPTVVGLIGETDVDSLLRVDARSSAFKKLQRIPEVKQLLDEATKVTRKTSFGHKAVKEQED